MRGPQGVGRGWRKWGREGRPSPRTSSNRSAGRGWASCSRGREAWPVGDLPSHTLAPQLPLSQWGRRETEPRVLQPWDPSYSFTGPSLNWLWFPLSIPRSSIPRSFLGTSEIHFHKSTEQGGSRSPSSPSLFHVPWRTQDHSTPVFYLVGDTLPGPQAGRPTGRPVRPRYYKGSGIGL